MSVFWTAEADSCTKSRLIVMNRDTSVLLLFLQTPDCFISDLSYYETSRNFEPTNRWEVSQRNVSIRTKKKKQENGDTFMTPEGIRTQRPSSQALQWRTRPTSSLINTPVTQFWQYTEDIICATGRRALKSKTSNEAHLKYGSKVAALPSGLYGKKFWTINQKRHKQNAVSRDEIL